MKLLPLISLIDRLSGPVFIARERERESPQSAPSTFVFPHQPRDCLLFAYLSLITVFDNPFQDPFHFGHLSFKCSCARIFSSKERESLFPPRV